ncbi:ABC transporter [Phytophthora megakarya]|uniref:ABC transporter n=1 Tax=Phytophthora megakarya TaxID=4795 RepID=A0A225WW72_9STRA|nr:ABC transporter [Phytophthora megakarya]
MAGLWRSVRVLLWKNWRVKQRDSRFNRGRVGKRWLFPALVTDIIVPLSLLLLLIQKMCQYNAQLTTPGGGGLAAFGMRHLESDSSLKTQEMTETSPVVKNEPATLLMTVLPLLLEKSNQSLAVLDRPDNRLLLLYLERNYPAATELGISSFLDKTKIIPFDDTMSNEEANEVMLEFPKKSGMHIYAGLDKSDVDPSEDEHEDQIAKFFSKELLFNRTMQFPNILPFQMTLNMLIRENTTTFSNDELVDIKETWLSKLQQFGLDEKCDALSKTLSGGQKRKLSLVLSLLDTSRVLLLDEPTAGMDLKARLDTWDALKRAVTHRAVILTTHSMQEAQALKYVPNAAIMSDNKWETRIQLNDGEERRFAELFRELETMKQNRIIKRYAIAATDLEDVFVKVTEGEDVYYHAKDDMEDDQVSSRKEAEKSKTKMDLRTTGIDRKLPGWKHSISQLRALVIKRMKMSSRDKKAVFAQYVWPIAFFAILMAVFQNLLNSSGSIETVTTLPPSAKETSFFISSASTVTDSVADLVAQFEQSSHTIVFDKSATTEQAMLDAIARENATTFFAGIYVSEVNWTSDNTISAPVMAYSLYYNETVRRSLPVTLQWMSQAYCKARSKHENAPGIDNCDLVVKRGIFPIDIEIGTGVTTDEDGVTIDPDEAINVVRRVMMAFYLLMTMSSIVAFYVAPVVNSIAYILQFLPLYSFGTAILNIVTVSWAPMRHQCLEVGGDLDSGNPFAMLEGLADLSKASVWDWEVSGSSWFALVASGATYTILLLVMDQYQMYPTVTELKMQHKLRWVQRLLPFWRRHEQGYTEAEQTAVAFDEESPNVDMVRAIRISKVFNPKKKTAADEQPDSENATPVVNDSGQVVALNDVSFSVEKRDCVALLGVNGSGKSTMFEILTGGTSPTTGKALIDSCDVTHLELFYRLRCCRSNALMSEGAVIDELMRQLDLFPVEKTAASHLSGGNKRRLMLALALLSDHTSLLLLDEPSAGVDVVARRLIMEEAEAVCANAVVLFKGKVVWCGSIPDLKQRVSRGISISVRLDSTSIWKPEQIQLYTEHIRRLIKAKPSTGARQEGLERSSLPLRELDEAWEACHDLMHKNDDAATSAVAREHGKSWLASVRSRFESDDLAPSGSCVVASVDPVIPFVEFVQEWLLQEAFARIETQVFKEEITTRSGEAVVSADLETARGSGSNTSAVYETSCTDIFGLADVFALMEENKQRFHIAQYSVSELSLERVFEQFTG